MISVDDKKALKDSLSPIVGMLQKHIDLVQDMFGANDEDILLSISILRNRLLKKLDIPENVIKYESYDSFKIRQHTQV